MTFGLVLAGAAAAETGPVQTFGLISGQDHTYLTSALRPIISPYLIGNFLVQHANAGVAFMVETRVGRLADRILGYGSAFIGDIVGLLIKYL